MGRCCVTQGAQQYSVTIYKGRGEVQGRGEKSILRTDSHCRMALANTKL